MILRRGLAHYRLGKSLRPRLENIDFSSQILESFAKCFESRVSKNSQAEGFLMRKQGCDDFCAEISLDGYRTSKRQAPCFIAKSQRPKLERSDDEKTL